jgi:hypothetical protein
LVNKLLSLLPHALLFAPSLFLPVPLKLLLVFFFSNLARDEFLLGNLIEVGLHVVALLPTLCLVKRVFLKAWEITAVTSFIVLDAIVIFFHFEWVILWLFLQHLLLGLQRLYTGQFDVFLMSLLTLLQRFLFSFLPFESLFQL